MPIPTHRERRRTFPIFYSNSETPLPKKDLFPLHIHTRGAHNVHKFGMLKSTKKVQIADKRFCSRFTDHPITRIHRIVYVRQVSLLSESSSQVEWKTVY